MSVLTRIKNNQITDATIWANAKIIPGSIVGSLFNASLTMTSDVTITGNLTVQGASTYLTVASTNTYVNDPLIVLNNAFSGSNSYDLGFIFNRGSDPNKAFYWDESSDEFRLITTTETGTTYGSITAETNYEKLRLGNLVAQYDVSTITLTATGLINTTGNISGAVVNGGAINSTGLINTTGNVSAAVVIAGQFNTTGNLSATQVSAQTVKASGLTSGRVVFTSTDGLLVDNAGITFTANTLTVGGSASITIDGATATIATTGTNQDLILSPNGSGDIDASTSKIINVVDPTDAQDVVTLSYLQSQVSSGVNNIQDDNSSVAILDTGANGRIEITVDTDLVGNITQDITTLTNDVKVSNTTVSTTTTSGALVVTGGVGVAGNITVGSRFKSTDDTQSTSTTTGAIITAGGIGIAKNLTVGGDATITGNLNVQGVLTAIQSSTLEVNDLQVTLAKGAGSSAAADGAGINVDYGNVGANITYTHATTSWNFNRAVIGSTYANFGGNVLATNFVGGGVNVSGNVLAAQVSTGTLNATGLINTLGNISAAVIDTGALNSTGFINTSGNISAVELLGRNLTTRSGYGNINLTQYNSIFADGNGSQNIVAIQLSTTGLSDGMGMLGTTGLSGQIYSTRGIVFNTGVTVRNTDTPQGGVIKVAITPAGDLWANATTPASSTTTGAFVVKGGVGIGGNLYAGAGIQDTAIGNVTAASGDFTRLAATGTVYANATTDTSSLTTGALIVAGGTAVGKTLWVGEGAVINSTRAAEAFQVYGATGNNGLIYADTAKSAIVFSSTGNTTVQNGTIVKFDSAGAIVLPVGSNAQRPGAAGNVDVAGMLRFNNTSNGLEYFDGADWTVAGSEFTVITTNSFSGNGAQYTYTLSSSSTTAGTLVMINGVVQIPTTAYSVTGTSLTFTEAPATGDAIDARVLITTATVSAISSGNGFNNFDVATAPYANVTAGTSAATVRMSVDGVNGKVTFTNDVQINGSLTVLGDSNGNINIGNESGDRLQLRGKTVYDQTAINVPDANLKELDSFSVNAFTTARYTVQVVSGGSVSAAELLVSHDDATSNIATYAVLGTISGTFQSNISSGTVKLFYTPSGAQNANIKVLTTYIV